MKALEILIGSKDNVTYLLQSGKLNSGENKKYENRLKFINEAIKEIEDLEILSCSGCAYEYKSNNAGCNICSRNFPDRFLKENKEIK